MGDQVLPEKIVIQILKPNTFESGFIAIKYVRISKFNNYEELKSYLIRKCGGGSDNLVITYNKYNDPYNDMNFVMRKLRTESWDDFAASVSHICVKRVEA